MTPERLREIERLFHEARERPSAERDAFLARVCADDLTLRREVESLLAQPPAGVLDGPLGALVAELVPPAAPRLAPGSSVGPYRIERLLDVGGERIHGSLPRPFRRVRCHRRSAGGPQVLQRCIRHD